MSVTSSLSSIQICSTVHEYSRIYILVCILKALYKVVLKLYWKDRFTFGWRKLHNEELHGLYSSPSIVRVIKARRMRLAGHVAHGGGEGCI
jgi:hypothetical protein